MTITKYVHDASWTADHATAKGALDEMARKLGKERAPDLDALGEPPEATQGAA
jgi:hypothetical protein